MSASSINVRHNMEVAHRLYLQPGKCQNIHGHSMMVKLTLYGEVNEEGIFGGADFSVLKKMFRGYIDETYDHRLLLNAADPWAHAIMNVDEIKAMAEDDSFQVHLDRAQTFLPGLQACMGDPTTENLAKWICEAMTRLLIPSLTSTEWPFPDLELEMTEVEITETGTNGASYLLQPEDTFGWYRDAEVPDETVSGTDV